MCTLFFELSHLSQMWHAPPALAVADVSNFPSMPQRLFLFPYWGEIFPSRGRKISLTRKKMRALGISLSHGRDLYTNFKKPEKGAQRLSPPSFCVFSLNDQQASAL